MTGIFSSPRALRMAQANVRKMDKEASPAVKSRGRLIKRICAHNWELYEGWSTRPGYPGEYLVHMRAHDGERRSIRITISGRAVWLAGKPVTFVPELFAEAAQ